MPDITMCQGAGDPLCEICYRKQATPDGEHQSWFAAPPLEKAGKWFDADSCAYFIRIPSTGTATDEIDAIVSMFSNTTESDHE